MRAWRPSAGSYAVATRPCCAARRSASRHSGETATWSMRRPQASHCVSTGSCAEFGLLHPVQLAAGERAQFAQFLVECRTHWRRQVPLQPGRQQRIVVELVAQCRR